MPEMVSRDGHINTEVFMPIEMISEKLPALKVGSYKFVWLLYIVCKDTVPLFKHNLVEPDPYAGGEDLVTCYTRRCSAGV